MAAARGRTALSTVAREQEERLIERELRHRFTAADLGPEDIVRLLRDSEIARLEAGLALLAGLDLLRVRTLLYGMNKRGFAAPCARAGFGPPHYIALRMALDLAEQGSTAPTRRARTLPRRSPPLSSNSIRSGATGRR